MSKIVQLKDKNNNNLYPNNIYIVEEIKETNTDLDNYTKTGIYYFSSSFRPINIPVGVNGWLVVMNAGVIKQIWYRHGTANSNDYNTYIRTYTGSDWSDWHKIITENDLSNLMFYKKGDIYQLNDTVYTNGVISSGSQSLLISLNLPKRLDEISSITVNNYDITVRKATGGYALTRATSGFDVVAYNRDGSNITLEFNSPTVLDITNNSVIGISIYGLKLTFN